MSENGTSKGINGHMAGEAKVEDRLVVFGSNLGEEVVLMCTVPPSSSSE